MAVRGLVAGALAALAVAAPAGAERVAFLHGGNLVVLDLATRTQRVVLRHAGVGVVHWSGDGRLVSVGGRVAGGPRLPATELAWAPRGETAAYVTARRGVALWRAHDGGARVVPDGWGATTVAWSGGGRLAIGRSVCRVPCGIPRHREVWVWNGRTLRRVVTLKHDAGAPMPFMWDAHGRVVWWLWPDSGSIAADGVAVYADSRRIGTALMYPDYVATCGQRLALADGGDRYATHGKHIVVGGRDVSRDRSHSWVSPSCSVDGSTLVAAAGRNWEEPYMGRGERRAIWQLLPSRRQLTRPPAGWTDENPRVLADGSILFVRTHQTSGKRNGRWFATEHARLELLARGRPAQVADVGFTTDALAEAGYYTNYYGHYGWPWLLAVSR